MLWILQTFYLNETKYLACLEPFTFLQNVSPNIDLDIEENPWVDGRLSPSLEASPRKKFIGAYPNISPHNIFNDEVPKLF